MRSKKTKLHTDAANLMSQSATSSSCWRGKPELPQRNLSSKSELPAGNKYKMMSNDAINATLKELGYGV